LVLTPYIVRDSNDFQKIFERKLDEYETFAADYYGHKSQYRAHIDYRRKNGPLALLGRTVQKELEKIENGGTGDEFEIIIKPEAEPQKEETSPPSESEDSESAETTDESS